VTFDLAPYGHVLFLISAPFQLKVDKRTEIYTAQSGPRDSEIAFFNTFKQWRLLLVIGKSIIIDSRCRIVMKNFDSVPLLQRFSYVHHCTALQDRVKAHIRVNVATRFCKGN